MRGLNLFLEHQEPFCLLFNLNLHFSVGLLVHRCRLVWCWNVWALRHRSHLLVVCLILRGLSLKASQLVGIWISLGVAIVSITRWIWVPSVKRRGIPIEKGLLRLRILLHCPLSAFYPGCTCIFIWAVNSRVSGLILIRLYQNILILPSDIGSVCLYIFIRITPGMLTCCNCALIWTYGVVSVCLNPGLHRKAS